MDFELFKDEYDLARLELITPVEQDFQMWITPRFHPHYENACYEHFTADLVRIYAKTTDLFIDVGAHYGFFSLLVGRSNPGCKIVAFEPTPENFEILTRNLKHNNIANVEAINQAVSNKASHAQFNISTASDNCSFVQHPATPVLRQIDVQTTSLSDLLSRNKNARTLIKIDTDGHDLQVLEGCEEILRERDNVQLVLELNPQCCYLAGSTPEAILNKLRSLGYDCYFLNDHEHRLYRPADGGIDSWKDILAEQEETYINILCKKKRVATNALFFSHSSLLAGAERRLLELVEKLISDCDTACTVVLPAHGPLETLLQQEGAATLIAPLTWWCANTEPPDDTKQLQLNSQSFGWLAENLGLLKQINPDVVLTNTLTIPWGAVAASLLKRPHVWTINEFGVADHGLKFFSPFPQVLDFIVESSGRVVAVSEAVRNELFQHSDPARVSTIYAHIDNPNEKDGPESPDQGVFRAENALHLVISGTITKSKGQEDAVRAVIELVKHRDRRVELVVVGYAQAEFLAYLQELINTEGVSDCVHIVPFQENVFPVVRAADVVLVCSKKEAFGRVTLEAMLMGKPIVATNTGGTPEMIRDGETGLLYSPGNVQQLADCIERLLDDPVERARLGRNAGQYAGKKFTREKFGGEYHKILVDLKNQEYEDKPKASQFVLSQYQMLLEQKHDATRSLAAQLAEREQSVQLLTAQLTERDQSVQVLTAQVAEIRNSKAWRTALLLRRARVLLAPPNSRRARVLRRVKMLFVQRTVAM